MINDVYVPGDLVVSNVVLSDRPRWATGEEDWAPIFPSQSDNDEDGCYPASTGEFWTFTDIALVIAQGVVSDRRWWSVDSPQDKGPLWYLVVTSRGYVGYVHYSQIDYFNASCVPLKHQQRRPLKKKKP